MKLLELNHVEKSFGDLSVIKDISMSVKEGEIVSIIGPSGSGKSTLLRCATMLETRWYIWERKRPLPALTGRWFMRPGRN